MAESKSVYAIGTTDTKGDELAYVAGVVRAAGARVILFDVGAMNDPAGAADVSRRGGGVPPGRRRRRAAPRRSRPGR
jgi:uncharacterized protein (UPF0261 family)